MSEPCHFIHTPKSGGPAGRECGRPESQHCPDGYTCEQSHGSVKPGVVHHPFHRRPLEPGCYRHGAHRPFCRDCTKARAAREVAR